MDPKKFKLAAGAQMHVDHIDLRRYKKYKRGRERDGNLCGYYKYDKNNIHDSI